LTPLGAPEEFTRRLTVNETIRYVEVGRASKNAEKGLVAGRENAWFDSPIMSRQHAKFSIKPSKVRDLPQHLVIMDLKRICRQLICKTKTQHMGPISGTYDWRLIKIIQSITMTL
jgi:hypothetical protein